MAITVDTIAAPATPAGTSALAVVRVSGPLAFTVTEAIFRTVPPPRQACHSDYVDQSGTLVDDVVHVFFGGPNSYTGEDLLEISCHGNPFIVNRLLADLYTRGCRPAEPGEFTRRAFLNGRMDLSQAEAVADLIHARSERALAAANHQLRGALGRRMRTAVDRLVDLIAQVEAYLDFPDEDLPAADRQRLLHELGALLGFTERILATDHYGQILRDGLKTVILGEPNAGKSSLLNRLLGRERALVSAEPGTTRDYLEEPITLGLHCIRLIDTAGLNPAPSPLERLGMGKTLERTAEADLVLLLLDATRPCPALPAEVLTRLHPQNTLAVINKTDLSPSGPHPVPPAGLPVVRISALTGAGCEKLRTDIAHRAESFRVELGDDIVAVNARHARALAQAIEALRAVVAKLETGPHPDELLASDLRTALASFEEIAGKVDNECILDHLFSKFCIGK